ncbi:MAG: lipopolysaccharide assembly protein LapB [Gammaproteobacteria bacterium]|nr:lipopolysaccharide assembly protein LapB [Gammaproteobacteria bacterium]
MFDQLGWLLVPVVAASGWWWARRNLPAARDSGVGWDARYFEGLNYLLNEEQDKAVEVFIKMLEVNRDTVEIHLALGHLFRRRGEVDRAIRLHQNLAARPYLNAPQRDHATFELAQDYLSAGLLDHAEKLFLELKNSRYCSAQALGCLVDVYEREREWSAAITFARQWERASGERRRVLIAQHLCELACEARASGNIDEALRYARQALRENKISVRASLLLGELETSRGEHDRAVKAYLRIEKQNSGFIGEAIEPLVACWTALNDEERAHRYLMHLYERYGSYQALLAITRFFEQRHGEAQVRQMLVERLRAQPSVMGMQRLVELLMRHENVVNEDLSLVKQLLERLAEESITYVCSHCGFGGKMLFWQCPGCRQWDSVQPRWAFQTAKGV